MPSLLLSVLMHLFDIKAVCEAVKGERGGNQEALKVLNKLIQSAKLNFSQKSFPCFYNNKPCGSSFFIHYLAPNPTKACAGVRSFVEDFIFVEGKRKRDDFRFSFFWQMNGQC